MNITNTRRFLLIGFLSLCSFLLINQPFIGNEGRAEAKVKIAVLGKVATSQSAMRFEGLFPELSRQLKKRFAEDGRFEVLSSSVVEGAIRDAGVEKFDLDNVEQLKRIGRNAGADVVCASSYYEMGGHAMPMHGHNVFVLVWVESTSTVKLDKKYNRAISADYLKSSDTNAFKELVSKADSLLPSR